MTKLLHSVSALPPWSRVLTTDDSEIPLSAVRKRSLIALELTGNSQQCLVLATGLRQRSPEVMDVCSRLRVLGYRFDEVIVVSDEIIATLYEQWQERQATFQQLDNTETEEHFSRLIAEADELGASDIHLICGREQEQAKVRLRIHGRMVDYREFSVSAARRLCSSVYNSIAEDREVSFNAATTQDANIALRIRGTEYRLRYSHAPNHPHGFHAAIRILRAEKSHEYNLQTLGFLPGQIRLLENILQQPDGAIIIAGTTGSGKSTTINALLSWLNERNDNQLNILTVEDPPEYDIAGAIQSPVVCSEQERGRGRNDFEKMVRSSMRRDPDVLMIGEIRDLNTALSFIQAIQSGHLCVTTLHARDCFAILSRLIGLGANMPENPITRMLLCEPGFLSGLLYQRLLPVLCPHCSIADSSEHASPGQRQRGAGCKQCRQGISGRTVCAQIVQPDHAILALMSAARDHEAKQLWQRYGQQSTLPLADSLHGVSAQNVAEYKLHQGILDSTDVQRYFGAVTHPLPMDNAAEEIKCISHCR